MDRTLRVLNRGGFFNPDVLLVAAADGAVVVKDFAPRSWWVRATIGRWLNRREIRVYRRLDGIATVPRWIGRVDALAFAIEYRPGVLLSRSLRGRLPPPFMSELETGVREMHARRVVHLDLRHRSNVLAGHDGHPVILDFASAIRFRQGRARAGWLFRFLASLDRRALDKWRVRIEHPDASVPGGELARDPSDQSGVGGSTASAGLRGINRPM